jgi:hypothetical protein
MRDIIVILNKCQSAGHMLIVAAEAVARKGEPPLVENKKRPRLVNHGLFS